MIDVCKNCGSNKLRTISDFRENPFLNNQKTWVWLKCCNECDYELIDEEETFLH